MISLPDIEAIEIRLLLEAINQAYGYDFRDYSDASLKRRLTGWLHRSNFKTFSEAQGAVLRSPECFDNLLCGITVNVSDMFRDPSFYLALRQHVTEHLKTWPVVKIWVAGCSTGEEIYSLAILLAESGFTGHYRLYATDINETVLEKAKDGVFPLERLQKFSQNYLQAGGRGSLSDYYTARYDRVLFNANLRKNVVFASHNLATDGEFGEMHLILCRNVLIYFNALLKERVLRLFDSSLSNGGFLCLGMKETLDGRSMVDKYEEVLPRTRIYRKRYT